MYNIIRTVHGRKSMNRKSVLILVTIVGMICFGYRVSHPLYNSYDERHKAGFINFQKGDFQLAEWSFNKAAEMEPEKTESYAALYWFYAETGEMAKKDEIADKMKAKEFDFSLFERVLSEYNKIKRYDAEYIKNTDNAIFEFYDKADRLIEKHEIYNDNEYKYYSYTYNENSLLESEICESRTPVYYYSYNDKTEKYDKRTEYTISREEKEYIYNGANKPIKIINDPGADRYYYYDKDNNLERIEIKNSLERVESIEYYSDDILCKIDFLDYDEKLKKQELYNSDGKLIKTVCYNKYNEITDYQRYTYEGKEASPQIICKKYTHNNILSEIITTIYDGSSEIITTEKYNPAGEIVKTTVQTETQTTVKRASDNIVNDRPFTEQEIDYINNNHSDLAFFIGGYEIPQDMPLANIIKYLPADEILDFYDIDEIDNLREEGIHTNIWGADRDYYKHKKFYFDTIEKFIGKYMNISPLDLTGFYTLAYSERYNSFYGDNLSGTMKWPDMASFECVGGVTGDNYRKLYTPDHTMVFSKTDSGYYLTACYGEDHSDLLPRKEKIPTVPQQTQDEKEYFLKVRNNIIPAGTPRADVYNKFINEFIAERGDGFPIYEENGKSMCWLSYALYDITKDGLPELFLLEGIAIPIAVYTYKDGQVILLDSSFSNGHNGQSFVIEGGMVGYRHSTTSVTYYFTKYYPDSTTESFSFGYGWNDDFYINHKSVTREEYIEFARPYIAAYNENTVTLAFKDVTDKIYVND